MSAIHDSTIIFNPDKAFYDFEVVGTDDGNGGKFATKSVKQNIRIYVVNVNDPPVLLPQIFTIRENQAPGQIASPAMAGATDEDGDDITFSLQRNDGGVFEIVDNKLRTTLLGSQSIDFESSKNRYSIDITAIDDFGASVTATYRVDVLDANDKPVFTSGTSWFVKEEKAGATVCVSPSGVCSGSSAADAVTSTDPDSDPSDKTTYAIVNDGSDGAKTFNINTNSGLLSLNGKKLDYENNAGTLQELPGELAGMSLKIRLLPLVRPPILAADGRNGSKDICR